MTNVMNNFNQIELEEMSDEEIVQYFDNFMKTKDITGIFDSYGNEIDPSKFSEKERAYWLARMDIDKKILDKAKEIVKSREVQNEFADMEYKADMMWQEEMDKLEQDKNYEINELWKTYKAPVNWMIEMGYIAVNNGKLINDKDVGGFLVKDPNPNVKMSLTFTQKYYDYIYEESLKRAVKRVLAEEKKKKKKK